MASSSNTRTSSSDMYYHPTINRGASPYDDYQYHTQPDYDRTNTTQHIQEHGDATNMHHSAGGPSQQDMNSLGSNSHLHHQGMLNSVSPAVSIQVKGSKESPSSSAMTTPSPHSTKSRPSPTADSSTVAPTKYTAVQIGTAVMSYASVSLCIVYFNWWLFTDTFKYPVFVSWFQQIIGAAMYCVFAGAGRLLPGLSNFPCIRPNIRTAIKILPLAISFVLMVAFANICLKYVHVSTYQVARSLTIIMTIILSYGILGQKESRSIIGSCLIMVLGFIVGSLDPSTLSLGGVITGACSSVSQAFYNVIIKKSLVYVDNNTNVMLLYNQLISSLLFIPVIFIAGEAPGIRQSLPLDIADENFVSVWSSLVFSGLLAASMNVAAYLCVKMTSPLTFNIVGVTKSLVQSLGGFVFLGDAVTVQAMCGIMLSLCGTAYYSFVKTIEKEHAKRLAGKSENTANVMLQGTQQLSAVAKSYTITDTEDDDENNRLLNVARTSDESVSTTASSKSSVSAHHLHHQHNESHHNANMQRSRHVLASMGEKEV